MVLKKPQENNSVQQAVSFSSLEAWNKYILDCEYISIT